MGYFTAMSNPHNLLKNNRLWSQEMIEQDPDFYSRLVNQQAPEYLWIGCSDSRVPANEIVGMEPGELFVHRNVANVVVHSDLNCLSVIEYAVRVLEVKHILIVGHYGCGGVKAALHDSEPYGLADNWLRHVRDVARTHESLLPDEHNELYLDRLCELNVLEQARNAAESTVVREAWRQGKELSVHSWVYRLTDGLVRDLNFSPRCHGEVEPGFFKALTSPARLFED
jgi:carbonic anhydrase